MPSLTQSLPVPCALADDCTFGELGIVDEEWESIEAKLRSGISKHTLGAEAHKAADLVAELTRVRESLRRAATPSQISGRQLMFTVRRFYQVDEDEHGSASFELGTLLAVAWPGDRNLGQFKIKWDHIVRHLRTPLGDHDLEKILVEKVRPSELLRPHLEYYDRLPRRHKDKSYSWLSEMIDQLILNERHQRNTQSLVLDASGKEQIPVKPKAVMPGQRQSRVARFAAVQGHAPD